MRTQLYELGGRAKDAAARLHRVHMAIRSQASGQAPDIPYPVSLDKIIRFGRAVDAYAHERVRETMADDLAMLGQDAPVVTVHERCGEIARAYKAWPDVYTGEMQDGVYYLYAPIAHDGAHFVPPDSRAISGPEEERVGRALFGEGWLTPFPILPQPMQGTALPAGYTRAAGLPAPQGAQLSEHRVFVAGGAAMRWLQAYQADMDSWKRGMNDALNAAQAVVRAQVNAGQAPAGLGDGLLQFSSSYAHGDTPHIELTLRRERDGTPVTIPQSAEYSLLNARAGHARIIMPAPAPQTQEGRDFKAIYNDIPRFVRASDYGDLGGPGGIAPTHVKRGGYDLLLYWIADSAPDFRPAGATPMSRALHGWIMADENDAQRGVTPPPMPQDLRIETAALGGGLRVDGPKAPALT